MSTNVAQGYTTVTLPSGYTQTSQSLSTLSTGSSISTAKPLVSMSYNDIQYNDP